MIIDITSLPADQQQQEQMLVDFQTRLDKEIHILVYRIRLLRCQLYRHKSGKTISGGRSQFFPLFCMLELSGKEEKS